MPTVVLGSQIYEVIPTIQAAGTTGGDPVTVSAAGIIPSLSGGSGAPSGAPTYGTGTLYIDTTNYNLYVYEGAAWHQIGGGVTSFSAGTTGFTPSSATTGAVTLAGTLGVANGGTGITTTPANGQLLIGNGTNYTDATLTAGAGITITNAAGSITVRQSSGTAGQVMSVAIPSTSTTTLMAATALPTTSTGVQIATLTVTPTSTSSKFVLNVAIYSDSSANNHDNSMAVFRETTCIAAQVINIGTSGRPEAMAINCTDSPATTAATTYTVRFGPSTAATAYCNIDSGGTLNFGGTVNTSAFSLVEIL